ncbi:MAG: hypothetical protein A2Z32_13195 [Chloroflexi bacterium RBG_16_69_14]|nr:MAG: hypothetical protein A2Z32_13195 [Chloroflexi bacterium RBG_16_69_14]
MIGIVGLALAGAAAAANLSATITGFAFAPDPIILSVGDTVTWTNNDPIGHTVTANDGSFTSGTLGLGATFSHTSTSPGTIAYHCAIHAFMAGTLVVQAAATPAASPTPTATPATSNAPTARPSPSRSSRGSELPPATDTSPPPASTDAAAWKVVVVLLAGVMATFLYHGRTIRRP